MRDASSRRSLMAGVPNDPSTLPSGKPVASAGSAAPVYAAVASTRRVSISKRTVTVVCTVVVLFAAFVAEKVRG